MTTTDNTAQSWRDLTDQLTTEQITQLDSAKWPDEAERLEIAREMAARNLLQVALADVAAPAGTTKAGAWYAVGDEQASRTLYADTWPVGNVTAIVIGEQLADGSATWQLEIHEVERTNGDLTAEQARELARVLLDAADKLDQLDGTSPPFM